MLHTKFGGNQPACSREDFKGFLPYIVYRHGGHLGHVTSIISNNFHFHVPRSLHTKSN